MILHIISLVLSIVLIRFSGPPENHFVQDPSECLVKTSSEWGSQCSACFNSKNSYRVNLKNQCPQSLDVVVAVKEKTNRWRTFRMNNMAPGDTISAYACDGAGKYRYWSRPAGDKTIELPTDDDIQKELESEK